MAHIKNISFAHVGALEGCKCDRCGQYIKNIITVEYREGFKLNYGIDCFENLYKSGKLNKNSENIMKKALKSLDFWTKKLEEYKNNKITIDNDEAYQYSQREKDDYWYNKPYEEWKQWNMEEFIPYRIESAQKKINLLSKIDFEI